ncbi:cytochrome P450 [Lactarius pseudohatsudake]|nr:cytochrome P450 [Lactarius pseudohatsudake]
MGNQIATLLPLVVVPAFLARIYYHWRNDFLRKIRGPDSSSLLYGNDIEVFCQNEVGDCEFKWARGYGNVWRQHGCLGKDHLVVADPEALRYILHVPGYHFDKRKDMQKSTELTFGRGLVWATADMVSQGETHRRQRGVMNPAFSAPQMRTFLPMFQNSASKLAQMLKEEVIDAEPSGQLVVDVTGWLSRTTLDIIGELGFGFQFGSLDGLENPLRKQNESLFIGTPPRYRLILKTLWYYLPEQLLDLIYLPTPRYRQLRRYSAFMRDFSQGIVERSIIEGDGKDLMSVLLRANASEDPRRTLSDIEMVDQIATLLFAGHDTTAKSLTWYLYEIARNPECQERVRAEIAAIRAIKCGEELSATDLESMAYTLATIKVYPAMIGTFPSLRCTFVMQEALRLHPIVNTMPKEATRDDVIPLSSPIVTKSGEQISSIPVRKGTLVDLAVGVYNRLPEIWGADANEFKPERFLDIDKSHHSNVGVFSNLMTFSSGPSGCIGWRFAVLEMQTIIVTLLENFEFSLPPQTEKTRIYRKPVSGLMTPMVEVQMGSELDLWYYSRYYSTAIAFSYGPAREMFLKRGVDSLVSGSRFVQETAATNGSEEVSKNTPAAAAQPGHHNFSIASLAPFQSLFKFPSDHLTPNSPNGYPHRRTSRMRFRQRRDGSEDPARTPAQQTVVWGVNNGRLSPETEGTKKTRLDGLRRPDFNLRNRKASYTVRRTRRRLGVQQALTRPQQWGVYFLADPERGVTECNIWHRRDDRRQLWTRKCTEDALIQVTSKTGPRGIRGQIEEFDEIHRDLRSPLSLFEDTISAKRERRAGILA